VELYSDSLAAMGQPALPTFVPPRESLAGDANLASEFPFALLTPKQHARFLNSGYAQLPKHGRVEGGPYLEMCAADAEALGVADADTVRVWNRRADLRLPVRITGRLRPHVVAIPFGWWSMHHADGHVANSLTNDTLTDWGGGVAFSDTLVAIARV
jgi:anaerobic selenocysteine-containing dehydrogenase